MSHDLMTNYDACPTSSGCRCSIKFYKVLCDNNEIVAADMFQQLKRLLRPKSMALLREVGHRVAAETGEPRSTDYLLQRLSVAVQRGNCASVLGSIAT